MNLCKVLKSCFGFGSANKREFSVLRWGLGGGGIYCKQNDVAAALCRRWGCRCGRRGTVLFVSRQSVPASTEYSVG